jgi:hypothetical protein
MQCSADYYYLNLGILSNLALRMMSKKPKDSTQNSTFTK